MKKAEFEDARKRFFGSDLLRNYYDKLTERQRNIAFDDAMKFGDSHRLFAGCFDVLTEKQKAVAFEAAMKGAFYKPKIIKYIINYMQKNKIKETK